jgi:hypothetical protein
VQVAEDLEVGDGEGAFAGIGGIEDVEVGDGRVAGEDDVGRGGQFAGGEDVR